MKATPTEIMIAAAGRALAGVRTVFVGVGLPNSACNFARRTVAPDLRLIYESGVYGARPARIPLSIGDPALVSGAIAVCSMSDLFFLYLQGGLVEVAFLGAAQIDRFGNINTTVIGDWDRPKVRLPGSGGACEIATHAERVFVIMRLRRRAFVERLDFHTSPGHLGGRGERTSRGLSGNGPELVVTDKCLMGFEQSTGEMVLQGLYPGVSVEEVQHEVGWALKVSDQLQPLEALTEEEIRLLRQGLAPAGETK
jgi:glutaconate CoA-transferase subunit B